MHRQLRAHDDVLGVARDDPRAEQREALPQQRGGVVVAPRGVDKVHRIEVYGEHGPVHRAEQAQVALGAVGNGPGHRLDGVAGAPRLHFVEDLPDVLHRQLERLLRHVVRMRSVPLLRVERTRDIDATHRAVRFGQRQAAHVGRQVGSTFRRVGVEHIVPHAHLGQQHIVPRERRTDGLDTRRVRRIRLRADGRIVAGAHVVSAISSGSSVVQCNPTPMRMVNSPEYTYPDSSPQRRGDRRE